jgi:tetratricopeptide (TPR) repeat protein
MVTGAGALIAFLWAANPHAAIPAAVEAPESQADEQEQEAEEAEDEAAASRRRAEEALVQGDYEKARREFESILKVFPSDAPAQRSAGAALHAAGKFEDAAAALERAHHFEHHKQDPELHYLRGEALFVLKRDEEARREHRIAELEIGATPTERMHKLWLARIYARRGYVVLADRLYESMMPLPPKSDTEVALNQADAHLMNDDWEGGARVLRRYLATDPKNLRAREMLAWADEGGGNLDEEIAVRRGLVADYPTFAHKRDYGRALERGYNFPGARDQYGGALATTTGNQDQALVTSYNRMRYRTSPELTAGTSFRSDPQAWAWRLQAGASLPFGIRNHLAFMALHDFSGDWRANQVVGANVFDKNGSITTLASQLFLGYWGEGYLLAGLDGRFSTSSGVTADGQTSLGTSRSIDVGGNAELDVTPLSFMRVNTHIDINEQWYEAPIAVHEGGTMTGAISHVYLYPKTRWVLFDGGASLRRLTLAAQAGMPQSSADQLLAWAGLDFNLWTSYARIVKSEAMDERLARRVYMNDALVFSYRNYQLWTESQPDFRISLAPRAMINNGSLIFRKVLLGGRAGLDLHGGGGWDNFRHHALAQAGGGLTVATGWRARVLATYDLAYETATGFSGTLQIGWLTIHVDL